MSDMGAISALSEAVDALRRNPVLFAATFAFSLVSFGFVGATTVTSPENASLLSVALSGFSYLVTPFFVGGILAMAHEGLDGRARLGTLLAGGKDNYLRLLAATVLLGLLFAALAFAAVVVALIVGVFVLGAGSAGVAAGSASVLALLWVAAVPAVFLPLFFLQLYAAAVVVSDVGPLDALRRSARLVRRNLLSALGYTAVATLIGGGIGVLSIAFLAVARPELYAMPVGSVPEFGTGVLLTVGGVAVGLSAIVSAFASAFQVAFYEDCLARTGVGDRETADGAPDAPVDPQ